MLKLHVGTNRKIGQPDYGSAGASCNLELELDTGLFHDLDGLQQVVRRAYAACNQAVNDEIARLQSGSQHEAAQSIKGPPVIQPVSQQPVQQPTHSVSPQPEPVEVLEVRTSPAIQGVPVSRIPAAQFTSQPSPRPATVSQVKAIRAICSRRKINLVGLLRERFGLTTADELGIRQASDLIDELKGESEPGSNTGANASSPGTSTPSTNGNQNSHQNGNGAYAGTGGTR